MDHDHDNLSSKESVELEFRPLPGDRKELRNTTDMNQQSVLDRQNDIMALMVEQHQAGLLPPLMLSEFSGDPIEYNTFIRGFESQIERRLSSNDTRLRYLVQYLESEPKDLIKGCLHVDANKGYFEAKRLLQEKYGDPYKISNAYLKKATNWPNVKPGDETSLDRFSTFLVQCVSAMSSLSHLSILDHPHSLQNLVTKLPSYMQDRWRREVNRIGASHGMPGLADFSEFIKNEARIANDPIFSRGSLNQVSGQEKLKYKPKPRRDESFPKYMAGATITQDFIPKEHVHEKCVLCKGSHHLDHCPVFWKKSLENRKAWVKEKGLCFACYGPGYRANGCSQRRKCERCPGRHPTALHDDNFIPKITRKISEATSQDHKGDVPASKSACIMTSVGKPSCYTVNEES